MGFHVGQMVVCVTEWEAPEYPDELFPKLVRTAEVEPDGQGLRLHEIVNPCHAYEHNGRRVVDEPIFCASGFRPVTERPTDISVFTDMLTGAPKEMERVE